MKKDLKRFLKTAIRAAKTAGALQKRSLGHVKKIEFKGEINLVTEVDKACEEKILKTIRRDFPDHDILTEETGEHLNGSDYKWIIDPLDGTTNFAHAYPLFCVSIGLEYQGKMIVGVVYNPNLGELFCAVKGGGATLNGCRIHVSRVKELKRALLSTGFAYNVQTATDNNLDHFRDFLMTSQAVRRDGVAAIDLCYVACGRFDGFWELCLWPWDVAAGSLILQEAGGRITMFDGAPLTIYGKEILASNGAIHGQMMQVLKRGKR